MTRDELASFTADEIRAGVAKPREAYTAEEWAALPLLERAALTPIAHRLIRTEPPPSRAERRRRARRGRP